MGGVRRLFWKSRRLSQACRRCLRCGRCRLGHHRGRAIITTQHRRWTRGYGWTPLLTPNSPASTEGTSRPQRLRLSIAGLWPAWTAACLHRTPAELIPTGPEVTVPTRSSALGTPTSTGPVRAVRPSATMARRPRVRELAVGRQRLPVVGHRERHGEVATSAPARRRRWVELAALCGRYLMVVGPRRCHAPHSPRTGPLSPVVERPRLKEARFRAMALPAPAPTAPLVATPTCSSLNRSVSSISVFPASHRPCLCKGMVWSVRQQRDARPCSWANSVPTPGMRQRRAPCRNAKHVPSAKLARKGNERGTS
mmetsp:Transcript_115548/g.326639  ORF Transcript_115548/g.326639 Transcript_115548/m.326639 type:complete len:310 (-) Transcript_115548:262-1191(-)